MKPVAKVASPAAIAVLRQATALFPKRKKLSDGLLPSLAHQKASPNSDHNTGLAVDLTHDPENGIDCAVIFEKLKEDKFREAFGDGYALGYDRGAKDLLEVKDELEIAYKEADRLRSKIDNILANQEVLNTKPQEELCGDCGSSRSNHPYRHCFRPFKTDEGILDVRQFR